MTRIARLRPLLLVAVAAAGCRADRAAAPSVPPSPSAAAAAPWPRLALDPEASPVDFHWLSDTAVLVNPKKGARGLAALGNYVARAAAAVARARLAVWDDAAAWKRYAAGEETDPEVLAHKRAEYVKDGGAEPVDRYLVFDRRGNVVYQRDFRAWPLGDFDA